MSIDTYTKLIAFDSGESDLLFICRHPGVAKLKSMGRRGNKLLLTMPKYNVLNTKTVKDTKQFMIQLIDAMIHIHSKGIVFCDVKDDNIMLDGDRPVIIDFGSAFIGRSSLEKDTRTTDYYAAPEAELTIRSDVWSLGVVFLLVQTKMDWREMFSTDVKGYIGDILKKKSEINDTLINGMLETDPDKRWTLMKCKGHLH